MIFCMTTAPIPSPLSIEAYLRSEENARRKHEFVEGVVYAMAGATNAHNTVATNATGVLYSQLRGKPCRVFNSDVKVRVRLARGTRFYYPHAMVACQLNSAGDTFQDAPVVIVEVLSEATRRTDDNEKRQAYLSIDSLCVYIRVEQSRAEASVDRRTDDGFRGEHYVGQDAVIPLPEIECELKLSELFEGVEFVPEVTNEDEVDF